MIVTRGMFLVSMPKGLTSNMGSDTPRIKVNPVIVITCSHVVQADAGRQKTATAKFCRTFSSLTRAGVPILLSLEIVQETAGNAVIAEAIVASRQDVQEGIPLSVALGRKQVFPELALSMLAIGEETGQMDTMLSKVADFYEDEVEAAVKALTSMLEPAMIVIVGGIVGSILLAMYLPMFSIFDQIK